MTSKRLTYWTEEFIKASTQVRQNNLNPLFSYKRRTEENEKIAKSFITVRVFAQTVIGIAMVDRLIRPSKSF